MLVYIYETPDVARRAEQEHRWFLPGDGRGPCLLRVDLGLLGRGGSGAAKFTSCQCEVRWLRRVRLGLLAWPGDHGRDDPLSFIPTGDMLLDAKVEARDQHEL